MTEVEQYLVKNKVNIVKEIGPCAEDPKVLIAWMKEYTSIRGNAITKVVTRMSKPLEGSEFNSLELLFSPVLSYTYPIMENVEFLKEQGVFKDIKVKIIESPEMEQALREAYEPKEVNLLSIAMNILFGLIVISFIMLLLL
jgi:hypothetical protein